MLSQDGGRLGRVWRGSGGHILFNTEKELYLDLAKVRIILLGGQLALLPVCVRSF